MKTRLLQIFPWLVDVPWHLLLAAVIVLSCGALRDSFGLYEIVTACAMYVAFFFAGRSCQLSHHVAYVRERNTQDFALLREAQTIAAMYKQLYVRHHQMTGEHYQPKLPGEKPYDA